MIAERGGDTIIGELDSVAPSPTMTRVLSDVSEAAVTVTCGDCSVLLNLRPWQHELHLWRDNDLVWVGVPSFPDWTEDDTSVKARDLLTWLDHRRLPASLSFDTDPLDEIFQTIFEDAMRADDSPNINLDLASVSIAATRTVRTVERRMAGDEVRELARTGIDYTMIGRTLLVRSSRTPTVLTPILGIDHVTQPRVTTIGPDAATEAVVIGATEKVEGMAGGASVALGLVQGVFSEPRILDSASATDAAQLRVDQTRDPPLQLECTLKPDAPFAFADLVPGFLMPVRLDVGCKSLDQRMRLVRVNADASETVSIVLVTGAS